MLRSRVSHRWLTASLLLTLALATQAARASRPTVPTTPCPPALRAPQARCGSVVVPLDRADPAAGTLPIAFELFPRTDRSAPATEAIVVSSGGPGVSNTAFGWSRYDEFRPIMADRDLLIIDHRGMGRSAPIDCPALQHVMGSPLEAARACGASLGRAADRYGSGDVADDIDAVRAALGYDRIDYYGASYGGVDVRAYAYRYPGRLRSAVLDSPANSIDMTFLRT